MNWEMTERDFEEVRHLLPESVVALITVAGVEATLHLVRNFGGTNFPVSNRKRNSRQSQALHAALADEVGEETACKIEHAYGDAPYFHIPRCLGAMIELRNRFIRRQYDEMTSSGVSDTFAVRDLALAHHLAIRQVRYILKDTDCIAETARIKTAQGQLFGFPPSRVVA
ncbi:Mor transcription activator family protein [Neisseria yangbaofengii]|uniref:Mor transcription activator family protein n=1 Tax=Neisseria yangbaofengii TaxID=2709396 RepID=UPI0013ECB9E7|nr:Mor transcription activator family protein [Neisseria yangbaofengii]